MKLCAFILPYFGKFNNYFDLFLKSCKENPSFDWIIFTDDKATYLYPDNVKVVYITFDKMRNLFQNKFDIKVSLPRPYKLCDFKPTYGYVFSEYLENYQYWGHCDCDLLFGNLEKLLVPLLKKDYDKLFAAGHLTIYRNTPENNRKFMKPYHGRYLYREFLTTPSICWFDEDWKTDNIHSMFLESGSKVYCESLEFNPSQRYANFVQRDYLPKDRKYHEVRYNRAWYFWNEGNIIQIIQDRKKGLLINEYIYIHFQSRPMVQKVKTIKTNVIQILPNEFLSKEKVPLNNNELKNYKRISSSAYLFILNNQRKRVIRKAKSLLNVGNNWRKDTNKCLC